MSFTNLEPHHFDVLEAIAGEARWLKRGTVLRHEGVADQPIYLLLNGWAASAVTFCDGRRQIVQIYLPGDVLGLPSLAVTKAPDAIFALNDVEVRSVPVRGLKALFQEEPRLAALLFLISQEERVMGADCLAMMGRSDAASRFAGFILQLHERLSRLANDRAFAFALPLTQHDLADLMGVTTVHINRVVQDFRQRGIIALTRTSLAIRDYDALLTLADLPLRHTVREPGWLPS